MKSKSFIIGDVNFEFISRHENTRNGFRHLSELSMNGRRISEAKCTYLNRAWESYEFQSVMLECVDSHVESLKASALDSYKLTNNVSRIASKKKEELFKDIESLPLFEALRKAVKDNTEKADFGVVVAIASLGALFCDNQKDKNDWEIRMLKAGITGLEVPADWSTLSEVEKERRITKVKAVLVS